MFPQIFNIKNDLQGILPEFRSTSSINKSFNRGGLCGPVKFCPSRIPLKPKYGFPVERNNIESGSGEQIIRAQLILL